MLVGGSIRGVSLAGRNFPVAADADANLNVGGYENSVFRYGDGSSSVLTKRTGPSVTGLVVAVSDLRLDREFLSGVQRKADFVYVTLTLASGAVWAGRAAIVGPIDVSTRSTTAPISLEFDGDVERQQNTGINVETLEGSGFIRG